MTAVRVSSHAIVRYQERVANVTAAQALAALTSPVIRRAAEFGAPYVKLGGGQHVVLEGSTVVTVLPKDELLRCFAPARDQLRRSQRRPMAGGVVE